MNREELSKWLMDSIDTRRLRLDQIAKEKNRTGPPFHGNKDPAIAKEEYTLNIEISILKTVYGHLRGR